MSNSSSKSKLQLWVQNILWGLTYFHLKIILEPKTLWTQKIFGTPIFFHDQKHFGQKKIWSEIFCEPKNILLRNFFDSNFFSTKLFWPKIIFSLYIFFYPKNILDLCFLSESKFFWQFLAAMSSSRSDDVTQSVCMSVCSSCFFNGDQF